jgi:hypothetical protein
LLASLQLKLEERTILEYARKHISLIWIEDSAKSLALPKVNCLTPSQVDSSSEKVLEEGGRCAAGTRLRTRFARRYALTAVALRLGSDSFGGFLRKNRSRFISSCKRAPSKPALYTLRLPPSKKLIRRGPSPRSAGRMGCFPELGVCSD